MSPFIPGREFSKQELQHSVGAQQITLLAVTCFNVSKQGKIN